MKSALTANGLNPFALILSKGLDSNIVSLLDMLLVDFRSHLAGVIARMGEKSWGNTTYFPLNPGDSL